MEPTSFVLSLVLSWVLDTDIGYRFVLTVNLFYEIIGAPTV